MIDANPTTKSTCEALPAANGEAQPGLLPKQPDSAPASASPAPSKSVTSKGGPPLGSANALKHGGRARTALAIGKLPPKARGSERRAQQFRKWLLAELDAAGLLTSAADHLVQSAVLCEVRRLLVERWLRIDNEGSSIESRLELLKAADSALTARNKAIAQLGLSRPEAESDLAGIYASLAKQAPEKSAAASNGSKATLDTLNPAEASGAFPNASQANSQEVSR